MTNAPVQLWRILARTRMGVRAIALCAGMCAGMALISPLSLMAQEDTEPSTAESASSDAAAVEISPDITLDDLPQVRHLAAALSDPDSRMDTLFTMVAVAQMMDSASTLMPGLEQAGMERFRDDRAWLDRLAARYLEIPMRSTVLDPASWLVKHELEEQNLEVHSLVSPLGPGFDVLLAQLFDRSEEQLAATLLPEVMVRMELLAVPLWRTVRQSAENDDTLLALIAGLNTDWFEPWTAAEPPAPLAEDSDVLELAREMLFAIADTTTVPAAPDILSLKRLRFALLTAEAEATPEWEAEASYVLRLAAGIESLSKRHYLSFVESLLWVVADLLDSISTGQGEVSPIAPMLADLLPRISGNYAREFSDVDPRINAALAAAYDVAQNLRSGNPGSVRVRELAGELSDAVAQVVLQVPDMDYYFGQPVRQRVANEIDICISIAAGQNSSGEQTLTREQFDRCMQAMADLADGAARSAELSGDADGPFGPEHLARELSLPPWQRINYVLGYMHDSFPAMCQLPAQPLPNPLEWATLATLMAWFAERAPVYFQTPESEAIVVRMRQRGLDLVHALSMQADCFSGAGGGITDPVSRGLHEYESVLMDLVNGIREAELAFRTQHLAPAADVVLGRDANQRTSYRTEGKMITACDVENSCGMNDGLEATRAMIGLFPDAYLIADQSGLGEVQICYDNVEWVGRRSEPVRADDPFVANYFGHLSFELKGRYVENGEVTEVFGSRFVSPDEYHYLFAAHSDEVLDDTCPMERVGERIHATMDDTRRFRMVPNRLTYLTSARNRPSSVLAANWSQGAEWRDWFVTGIGVSPLEFEGDPTIRDRVNQHLQSLYQSQQAMVYSSLLRPNRGATGLEPDLFTLSRDVSNQKAFVRAIISLFYPSQPLDSDGSRAALEGQDGLLDDTVLSRLRDGNVAVSTISERGTARLEAFRTDWGRLPEPVRRSGSVSNSVAHALTRLNAVYRDFFGLQQP